MTQVLGGRSSNFSGLAGDLDGLPEQEELLRLAPNAGGFSLAKSLSTRTIREDFDYQETNGSVTRRGTLDDNGTSSRDTTRQIPTVSATAAGTTASYIARSDTGSTSGGGYQGVFTDAPAPAAAGSQGQGRLYSTDGVSNSSQQLFTADTAHFANQADGNTSRTSGTQSSKSRSTFDSNIIGATGPEGGSTGRGTFNAGNDFRTANTGGGFGRELIADQPEPDGVSTTDTTTISGGDSSSRSSVTDNSTGTVEGSKSSGNENSTAAARQRDKGFVQSQAKSMAPGDVASNELTTTRATNSGFSTGTASGTIGQLLAGQLLNLAQNGTTGGSRTLSTTRTTTAFTPTTSSRTVLTRTDKGSGNSQSNGTVKRETGDDNAQRTENGHGETTGAVDIVFDEMGGGSQDASGVSGFGFESTHVVTHTGDNVDFDAVFAEVGAENDERVHAILGHDTSFQLTNSTGWQAGNLDLEGWSQGSETTHTIEASAKTGGEATLVNGLPVNDDDGSDPASPSARSTDTREIHDWNIDLTQPDKDAVIYDRFETDTLTDTLGSTWEKNAQGEKVLVPTSTESRSVDWNTLDRWRTTAVRPEQYIDSVAPDTPATVIHRLVEEGHNSQTHTLSGDRQTIVVDNTLHHEEKTETTHDFIDHRDEDGDWIDPSTSEVVGTYQNQADAHLTYTLLDKITEDNAYHYDATHRVTEEGLAQDGEFHASDERHFEHVNTLRRVYESEVYNMGSSFSDSYALNLGYGYKDTIGPAFTNGVTNTTIDSLVTEDGHYRDAGVNSNGQPVRTSDGHADSTTTTRTATLNFEYSYFDTDPETYLIQPPEELPQTNWEHEIKETENLAVDSRTVVSAFTLDYGSGGGNRKPSDSISTNDDSNNWMHVWTQGYDAATDALGPEMEGDKTETHHLDASFPAAGQASGWAEGHVWGWQTDVDNDQLGDLSWVSGFSSDLDFDYYDPEGYDPINDPPPPRHVPTIPQPAPKESTWSDFWHDPLDWAYGGGGQEAHLTWFADTAASRFVGEGIRNTLGDDYLAHAGGWELTLLTVGAVGAGVGAGAVGGAVAFEAGVGAFGSTILGGAAGGLSEYTSTFLLANILSDANNGGRVADPTLSGLVGSTVGGAVTAGAFYGIGKVAAPVLKTIGAKVKAVFPGFEAPKVVPPTESIIVGGEPRPIVSQFDTGLPFEEFKWPSPPRVPRPGSISGNPANQLLDTGTPLKDGSGWAKRWFRITPEDAKAYQQGVAEFYENIRDLADRMRLSPDVAKQFRFDQMRQFRTNWLSDFLQNRSY